MSFWFFLLIRRRRKAINVPSRGRRAKAAKSCAMKFICNGWDHHISAFVVTVQYTFSLQMCDCVHGITEPSLATLNFDLPFLLQICLDFDDHEN